MSTPRGGAGRDDGTGARSDAVPGRDGTLTGRTDPDPGLGLGSEVALGPVDVPEPDVEVSEPDVVVADDLLLDALGRGGPSPGDDPLAGLLTAWRAELDADLPPFDFDPTAAVRLRRPRPAAPQRRPRPGAAVRRPPGGRRADVGPRGAEPTVAERGRPGAVALPRSTAGWSRRRTERPGGLVGRLVLSGVVGVVVTALLGLGVNHAGPTSPLWPVAAAVYPDRSAVRAVEHTVGLAREAVAERRYPQARAELDRATVQVGEIRDPAEAGRLRSEIERIRLGLPGAADRSEAPGGEPSTPARPVPTTPASERPTAPGRTPDRTPPPERSGPAQPSPADPPDGGLLPLLPTLLPSGLPLLPSGGCVLLCPPD
ncbi:anti-sigma-D factor RsdA [Micromonospora sp. WMMD1102]|uniref:anti-sigma-D factor RsdA n=1 Tax=Micromonospora sp. WMMD1102 TaxID=3016105 RepID=UPI0024157321|nr:anti-sigma-D factor RsdA [Micromonospora sp. WMMD1102]MDG4787538.1 anti-sigma-D factor RsdA [Micromonospora sp. WMMD1102]